MTTTPALPHGSRADAFAGGGVAWLSLAAAITLAVGLADAAHGQFARGVGWVAVSVVTRTIAQLALDARLARRQRDNRERLHRTAAGSLARVDAAGLHGLDAAIDAASLEPTLTAARAAAGSAAIGLVVIALAGGWLCVVIVVALLGLSIPAYVAAGRRSEAATEEFHRRRSVLLARQLDVLRHITDLRALGAVAAGADEIAAASDAEGRAVSEGVRRTIRSTLVSEFLAGVSVGLVAMVVGLELWWGTTSLLHALIAVLVTAETFGWWRRYGLEFHRRDEARRGAALLATLTAPPLVTHASELLELDQVRTAAPAPAVSVTVRAGDRVRVVGPSGAGKSSLVETAIGLREPVAGVVRRHARAIGWVHPTNHFVDGSLRENLAGDDATCRGVLDELGLTAPAFGLDRPVDADGRDLSSAERSLVALARALVADCDLLVLDDVAAQWGTAARERVAAALASRPTLAVVEAGHDVTVLAAPTTTVEVLVP